MNKHLKHIDDLRRLAQSTDSLIRREVENALPAGQLSSGQKRFANRLLQMVEPRHLTYNQLVRIRRNGLDVPRSVSFSSALVAQWERSRLSIPMPGREIQNKRKGYRFADAAGVRRPRVDDKNSRISDLEPQYPCVVKPAGATGAIGVYLVFSPEKIVYVRSGREIHGWDGLREHAGAVMETQPSASKNAWFREELILEDSNTPARDLKFYAFYGTVVLVLEVVRYPSRGSCFWDRDGNAVDTGHGYAPFDGLGVNEEDIRMVENLSRQIPRPFVRIDMLRAGVDGLVLGEFTLQPGGFDGFDEVWDRQLGVAWQHAESELIRDLVNGKRFDAYNTVAETRPS